MERESSARGGRWTRRILVAAGIALVVYILWGIWDYAALMRWMERARPVPFFAAMAVLPALGLPFTPFFLIAGATFGVEVGLIGTAIALAANLTFCYHVGRGRLRRRLVSVLERFDYELPDFDIGTGEQTVWRTVRFTALIKLAPGVPGFVKNYGLGAARVPFVIFFTVSMLISGAYAAALIVLGESLFEHELGRGTIAVVVAAVLALVLWWALRRQAARRDATHATAA